MEVEYRYMLMIVRDRVQVPVTQGDASIRFATQPRLDDDAHRAASSGPVSRDVFIAAVYEGLRAEGGVKRTSK